MSEHELMKVEGGALEDMRKRITALLPPVAKADKGTQLAVAYVTMAYGLDPFVGDLWAIPRKEKGKTVGWGLMFGIRGLRKAAFRSGQYDGCSFRWLTEGEADLLGVDLGRGDKAIACEVRRLDCSEPFVGFGVVRPDDTSRMNHGKLAKLRAERAALRMAFPVEVPGLVATVAGTVVAEGEGDEGLADEGDLGEEVTEPPQELQKKPRSAAQDRLDLFGEEVS